MRKKKRFFREQPSGIPHIIIKVSHCPDSTNTTFKDVRTYKDNVEHSNDLRVQFSITDRNVQGAPAPGLTKFCSTQIIILTFTKV